MIREDKEKNVIELQKVFEEAKSVYFADFTGIDVQMINDLRRQFNKENVTYRVVKNTLTRRSIEGRGFDGLMPYLIGPTAIAYSFDDPVAPGKLIEEFYKKNDKLELKAALIDGEIYDHETAIKIVRLPSKEQLIAQLLGTLNSPITGLVYVLSGVVRNVVSVIDQIRQKQETDGETQPSGETDDSAQKSEPEESAAPAPSEEAAVETDVEKGEEVETEPAQTEDTDSNEAAGEAAPDEPEAKETEPKAEDAGGSDSDSESETENTESNEESQKDS
ncbi:50S ribosomal protein L10 [candidate division KSB1 bacterium]